MRGMYLDMSDGLHRRHCHMALASRCSRHGCAELRRMLEG